MSNSKVNFHLVIDLPALELLIEALDALRARYDDYGGDDSEVKPLADWLRSQVPSGCQESLEFLRKDS